MAQWPVYQVDGAYRDFYRTLDNSQRAALDRHIVRLAERGPQIAEEGKKSLPIKGYRNLYELRPKNVRMFYCIIEGTRIVLLLGVVKDQRRLKKEVFAKAARKRDEVCSMGAIQWQRLTQLI